MFARNHSDPCRKISLFAKRAPIADRCNQSCGGDWANTWYRRESIATFILGRCTLKDPVHLLNALGELSHLQIQLR
jgi:hypothetical protein